MLPQGSGEQVVAIRLLPGEIHLPALLAFGGCGGSRSDQLQNRYGTGTQQRADCNDGIFSDSQCNGCRACLLVGLRRYPPDRPGHLAPRPSPACPPRPGCLFKEAEPQAKRHPWPPRPKGGAATRGGVTELPVTHAVRRAPGAHAPTCRVAAIAAVAVR